ncbi:unnamed protein product [Mytilus edulis]|uniref:Uncharacterized protein n=1 Tax=Mytilus edulis TaxID=6550 RepID=A0A8S3PT85_MYTED|nr:unnamed protein product [Mytilus edulis]
MNNLDQIDGDVLVSQLDGDVPGSQTDGDVPVSLANGDVHISQSVGDVPVSQSDGDVSVSQSDNVPVSQSDGDVPVSQSDGDVPVSLADGDVHISQSVGNVPVSQSVGDVPIRQSDGDVPVSQSDHDVSVSQSDNVHECKETIFIEDFLTPSSGHKPAALDNIEKVVQDLESNICSALKDRNRNLNELREKKRVIREQIKEKREEINTLLDNLEGELLEKASAMETEYCRKIEVVIEKLEDEKKKVDEIKKDIDFVKESASNLQIFIGTKLFAKNLSTNELNVQMLYNNGSFNNFVMECTLNANLDGLIREIKTFGDMKMDSREKHISFFWKSNSSAQLFKPMSRSKSIGNLHVRQFRSESKFIPRKCCIGYDLAVVDSKTVAVSSGGNSPKTIYLIDMDSTETQQEFEINDWLHGLSYHNGSFIFCTYDSGIKIIDMSQGNLTNVRTLSNAPKMVEGTYVTSNENGIFHSNWKDDSVVCYDFRGQVQWKFNSSLVRKPLGITLDSYSNIYLAGSESNNVVVISPDGKQFKELIRECDGLVDPRANFFDKRKNLLLVANHNAGTFLCDVYNA